MKNDNICACFVKKPGAGSKKAIYRVADGHACRINGQLVGGFSAAPGKGARADNNFGKTIPPGADDWDNAGYN
jgi:hypothetical protein